MNNSMLEKIYLHLLILCGIWSQGIIGSFADEDIKKPSDLLFRQKRVINRIPGEDKAVSIRTAPYVAIIKHNNRLSCVGSILSHYVVITSASCVHYHESEYNVVAGSSRANRGTLQDITEVRKHFGNHPGRPSDGIALLIVRPFFEFGAFNTLIELHSGPLLHGMLGTVSGWGYDHRSLDRGTTDTNHLRSIEVPIMAHRDCVNIYRPHHLEITDKDICTSHPYKHGGHTDGGAPLVVDGYLAGVRVWSGLTGDHDINYPDVFIMLQHSEYNQWIRTNLENVYAHFRNQHG